MRAGRQLQQVQAVDADQVDAGKIAEGLVDALVLVVDDERAAARDVAAVAQLALARADLARALALLHIDVHAELLQQAHGILGLLQLLDAVVDDHGHLADLRGTT